MGTGKHSITPLAAVGGGMVAGAVGTVCLDAVNYLKYRRTGAKTARSHGNSRPWTAGTKPLRPARSVSA
jgi:hypothetical protein